MRLGGAIRARARTSPDDVRIRQAVTGQRIPPGRGRMRQPCPRGFRHEAPRPGHGTQSPPQARSAVHPLASLKRNPDARTIRWPTEPGLSAAGYPAGATASNADGATLVTASPRALPHVTAKPGGPSSRLVENVRDPSGGGSGMSMAWGRRVGKKWEKTWLKFPDLTRVLDIAGCPGEARHLPTTRIGMVPADFPGQEGASRAAVDRAVGRCLPPHADCAIPPQSDASLSSSFSPTGGVVRKPSR